MSPTKHRELEIAYMNGYVNALNLDIEEVKRLKKDLGILKQEVVAAAEAYMIVVEDMNKAKMIKDYYSRNVPTIKKRYWW